MDFNTRGFMLTLLAASLAACSDSTGADDGPFHVVSVSPAPLAADVTPGTPVVVQFSRALLLSSVNDSTMALQRGSVRVSGGVTVSDDRRSVTFNAGLGNNQFYTLTIQTGVHDEAGNPLDEPFIAAFSTARASASLIDPAGDAFGTASTTPDLTGLSASQDPSAITIQLRFSASVASASSGLPNAVGGWLDIDVDQNAATGGVARTDYFGPSAADGRAAIGAEYVVSFWAINDSLYLLDALTYQTVGMVKLSISDSTATIRIPLALLGADDGNVNIATVVGTMSEPTDIAPNNGHLALGTTGAEVRGAPLAAAQHARPAAPPWRR